VDDGGETATELYVIRHRCVTFEGACRRTAGCIIENALIVWHIFLKPACSLHGEHNTSYGGENGNG